MRSWWQFAWWTLIVLLVILAVTAIVFAILAFNNGETRQPHRNLVRRDLIAKGDLMIDGLAKIDGPVDLEDTLNVKNGLTSLQSLSVKAMKYATYQSIQTHGGDYHLTTDHTSYRVDLPDTELDEKEEANSVVLRLPPVSTAAGHVFHIFVEPKFWLRGHGSYEVSLWPSNEEDHLKLGGSAAPTGSVDEPHRWFYCRVCNDGKLTWHVIFET